MVGLQGCRVAEPGTLASLGSRRHSYLLEGCLGAVTLGDREEDTDLTGLHQQPPMAPP